MLEDDVLAASGAVDRVHANFKVSAGKPITIAEEPILLEDMHQKGVGVLLIRLLHGVRNVSADFLNLDETEIERDGVGQERAGRAARIGHVRHDVRAGIAKDDVIAAANVDDVVRQGDRLAGRNGASHDA